MTGDGPLKRTPLHASHLTQGAKMVPFAGWEMPVSYPSGITHEHLWTRRHGSLFDVSHMGRFLVEGPCAVELLQRALTHDIQGLPAGVARYGLMAHRGGGTLDDTFLYRIGRETYLLVVNAGNADRDWAHLAWLKTDCFAWDRGCDLIDLSGSLAMLALQGPESGPALRRALGRAGIEALWPDGPRNTVRAGCDREGLFYVVARTGYTGEPVAFEVMVPAQRAAAWWSALQEGDDIRPAGLGARNTLRMEAGLPLYGDELSEQITGLEAGLHQLGIRLIDAPADFVGREALLGQYRCGRGMQVAPFVIEGAGRVPREGHLVAHRGEVVGRVTSGSAVPYLTPEGGQAVRRIGFACVPAGFVVGFRRGSDRRTGDRVEIWQEDPRQPGRRTSIGVAELVDRFIAESPDGRRVVPVLYGEEKAEGLPAQAQGFLRRAVENDRWRQTRCINLIPSENTPSEFVRRVSGLDPAGRYAEHQRIRGSEAFYYRGTAFIADAEGRVKTAFRRLFGAREAEVRPVSGQMANEVVFEGIVRYLTFRARRRGWDYVRLHSVLNHGLGRGGHLSAQAMGALYNFVALDPKTRQPCVTGLPVREDYPYAVDVDRLEDLIAETRPDLIIFGRSMVIEPEPVAETRRIIEGMDWSFRQGRRPVILYDMAHVLGLYGPHFQEPLREGADFVTGSTHKTFFGPQRGVALTALDERSGYGRYLWECVVRASFPGAVSNHHLGSLAGLYAALLEFEAFGGAYQRAVMDNAKAFAKALAACGLRVEGDSARGYTQTHQVLLNVGEGRAQQAAATLEANGIIVNPQALPQDRGFGDSSGLRMGTQEMTRFGVGPGEFEALAQLIADVLLKDKNVSEEVAALRGRHLEMEYVFEGV